MPTPIDDLEQEHELIGLALGILDRIADHVEAGRSFPTRDTTALLRFLREFVEAVHDRKVVEYVYPAVVFRGSDTEAEAAGNLVRDHDETRDLLHSLILFWEPVGELMDEERHGFARAARAYIKRMKRHMDDERRLVFSVARRILPADENITLGEAFAELDRQRSQASYWRRMLEPIARLWG